MKYEIKKLNGEVVRGEKIQTRGDDENFPTFLLEDGSYLGVYKDRVIREIEE